MQSILILGGTTEARILAETLASRSDLAVTLSLAGRTANPKAVPVPVRTGGFGGADGLADYLSAHGIDLLIDATHPFATTIADNAALAAKRSNTPAFALRRAEWQRKPGDRWTECPSAVAAIDALGDVPRHVFLTLGRQEAHVAERAPHHHYLVRSVDPINPPLRLPHVRTLLARGPFTLDDDLMLLRDARIDAVLCKNSGGDGAYAKIEAARALGIEVLLVTTPAPSTLPQWTSLSEALGAIDHLLAPRGA